jgi:hypothetical protein
MRLAGKNWTEILSKISGKLKNSQKKKGYLHPEKSPPLFSLPWLTLVLGLRYFWVYFAVYAGGKSEASSGEIWETG